MVWYDDIRFKVEWFKGGRKENRVEMVIRSKEDLYFIFSLVVLGYGKEINYLKGL